MREFAEKLFGVSYVIKGKTMELAEVFCIVHYRGFLLQREHGQFL